MLRNVCHTSNNQNSENLSRYQILYWLNIQLGSNVSKIDDLCTGAAYCQLFHKLRPKAINLKRVKFMTNIECEYIQNFKLLQGSFQKEKVKKQIPIERLVKGRFQDNLEFLQWFKKFHDLNYVEGSVYDAKAARENQLIGIGQTFLKPKPIRSGHTAVSSVNSVKNIKSEMISGFKGRYKKGPAEGDMSRSAAQECQLEAPGVVAPLPQAPLPQSQLEISDEGSTHTKSSTLTLTEFQSYAAPSHIGSPNIKSDQTKPVVVFQTGVSYLPLPPSGNQPQYVSSYSNCKLQLKLRFKEANFSIDSNDTNAKTLKKPKKTKLSESSLRESEETLVPANFCDIGIQVDGLTNSTSDEDRKELIPSPNKRDHLQDSDDELPPSCWSKWFADGQIHLEVHDDKPEGSTRLIKRLQEQIPQIIQQEILREVTGSTEMAEGGEAEFSGSSEISRVDKTLSKGAEDNKLCKTTGIDELKERLLRNWTLNSRQTRRNVFANISRDKRDFMERALMENFGPPRTLRSDPVPLIGTVESSVDLMPEFYKVGEELMDIQCAHQTVLREAEFYYRIIRRLQYAVARLRRLGSNFTFKLLYAQNDRWTNVGSPYL